MNVFGPHFTGFVKIRSFPPTTMRSFRKNFLVPFADEDQTQWNFSLSRFVIPLFLFLTFIPSLAEQCTKRRRGIRYQAENLNKYNLAK